jgi:1-acyl-sn-glycerol-3-phosphate acyltransferase
VAKPRPMRERKGVGFTVGVLLLKPLLWSFTRHRWVDGTKLPEHGGVVVVANHVSHVDPVTFAHFMWDHGRLPRFLAKAALFDIRVLGWLLRDMGQIPVHRETSDASVAFSSAVRAVEQGKAVIVYPEGTLTRDPDLWPMVGRTGAARIALRTGAPVVPVAQWGAHHLLYPYSARPQLLPPTRILMKVGDPVDLEDLRARPVTPETIHEATGRIMAAITVLLEDLRGEQAPAERFDPRRAGVRTIGNPHSDKRHARRRTG